MTPGQSWAVAAVFFLILVAVGCEILADRRERPELVPYYRGLQGVLAIAGASGIIAGELIGWATS